jgi:exonuclease SbcC
MALIGDYDAVGSPDGSRFRKFVQGITLEHLVRLANDHLSALGPRYQQAQDITSDLAVHRVDRDMAALGLGRMDHI